MKVGITINDFAYTPEAYAYEKYLSQRGVMVQLDNNLDPNNDINIYFMGIRPFWKKKQGRALEIHEYQSLSTPPYPSLKDKLKKVINRKPVGRIFLNNIVHKYLFFNDNIPYLYRDMGIDDGFFQEPNQATEFDIIYSGSITGRVGLVEVLLKLAKAYKIIVVGRISDDLLPILRKANIYLAGKVNRQDLPDIYKMAKFGLNYTPDIHPFNIQTSTKTLEYLASGLQVISNRYEWAEKFFMELDYVPIWLEKDNIEFRNNIEFRSNIEIVKNMEKYRWSNILENSDLLGFLRKRIYDYDN